MGHYDRDYEFDDEKLRQRKRKAKAKRDIAPLAIGIPWTEVVRKINEMIEKINEIQDSFAD
jgi:hypothetical protein